jgi:hypothetical protein
MLRFSVYVLLVICLHSSTSFSQESAAKLTLPDATARDEARKLIADVYKADYDKAKTSEQRKALAKKLLKDGIETANDATGRFVLLQIAMDIAAQEGDAETALRVVDEIDRHYRIDSLAIKATIIPKIVAALRLSKEHQELAPHIKRLIDAAVDADRYDFAKQLAELALTSATDARDGALRTGAADRIKQIGNIEREYASVRAALVTLDSKPTDPDANLVVGKFCCFIKREWDKGLSMLALGSDAALEELAVQELAGVVGAEEQVALADGWWAVSEKYEDIAKTQIQLRAAYWYQRALPKLSGLPKAKVEKRLSELGDLAITPPTPRPSAASLETTPTTTSEPSRKVLRQGEQFDLLPVVNAKRDSIRGTWSADRGVVLVQTNGGAMNLPVDISGDYDLRIEFARNSKMHATGVVLPVGETHCGLFLSYLSGRCHGLERIDGKTADRNATTQSPGTLVNGRRYTLDVSVRLAGENARIAALLDGKPLLSWEGMQTSLAMTELGPFTKGRPMLLANDVAVTYYSATIRVTSGTATVERP